MIYIDNCWNFEELLYEDNSVIMHHNNIHPPATKVYKDASDMLADIMNWVFKSINTPHYKLFHITPIRNIFNGTESASYLEPKILEQIPVEAKNKDSLDGFKKEIKKWEPSECPYRIFKTFVSNLSFVWTKINISRFDISSFSFSFNFSFIF